MQRISSCLFVVSSLLAAISPAMAAFPERAITLVVPFAAGGPTDALARLLGQRMSEVIKQPIIIENVGGAGSMLGTARAAKAPPHHPARPSGALCGALWDQRAFDGGDAFAPTTRARHRGTA